METTTVTNISTKEELMARINLAIAGLNEHITQDGFVDIILSKEAEDIIRELNSILINEAVEELLQMFKDDKAKAFEHYINNRYIMVKRLEQESKTGLYGLVNKQHQLSFLKLSKESKNTIASNKMWYERVQVFMYNLTNLICADLSDGVSAGLKTTAPKINTSLKSELTKKGASAYTISALEEELRRVCESILPKEMDIKMIKADVKYLKGACQSSKGGSVKIVSEGKFINELFTSLYFRSNSLKYEVKTNAQWAKIG